MFHVSHFLKPQVPNAHSFDVIQEVWSKNTGSKIECWYAIWRGNQDVINADAATVACMRHRFEPCFRSLHKKWHSYAKEWWGRRYYHLNRWIDFLAIPFELLRNPWAWAILFLRTCLVRILSVMTSQHPTQIYKIPNLQAFQPPPFSFHRQNTDRRLQEDCKNSHLVAQRKNQSWSMCFHFKFKTVGGQSKIDSTDFIPMAKGENERINWDRQIF